MTGEGMHVWERCLPHWRLDDSAYMVTWRLRRDVAKLEMAERMTVAAVLQHFHKERFTLCAYVVMDDHVHVVVRPYEPYTLDKLLHSWKSYSARELRLKHGRSGPQWVSEGLDRIIRSEHDLREKCEYLLTNPERRWPGTVDYPARGWGAD